MFSECLISRNEKTIADFESIQFDPCLLVKQRESGISWIGERYQALST
jgi:hypothetical protein